MSEKVYYPGLNGIRAIAAMIVLVFHIDLVSSSFGLRELGIHKTNMAGYGVILFFVLSGYLITSLLLKEKIANNNIKINKFYTRRILRIWPLYYLALFFGICFVFFGYELSFQSISSSILLYLFFLPNVAFVSHIAISSIAPLWSVGVEEQFYAIWPWIIKKSKNTLLSLLCVILIYFTIKLIAKFSGSVIFYGLVNVSAIDCMAIGGIGAYLISIKSETLKIIYHWAIQLISWLVLIISCIYKPIHLISFIDQEINAFFYIIIIVNVSTNRNTIISLENRFFDYIGKISYGIYVYHFIIITFLQYFIKNRLPDGFLGNLVFYMIVILSTFLVAGLSYRFFELRFLKMRKKFTVIESSNSRFD